MAIRGRCLCGAVHFEIDRDELLAIHCHCRMCQRAHGGSHSTHVVAKAEQVTWLEGEDFLHSYASSVTGVRRFCSHCGSQIVAADQAGPGLWGIPLGLFDGEPPVKFLGHMFFEEHRPWAAVEDNLPRYPGWPPGTGPARKPDRPAV